MHLRGQLLIGIDGVIPSRDGKYKQGMDVQDIIVDLLQGCDDTFKQEKKTKRLITLV